MRPTTLGKRVGWLLVAVACAHAPLAAAQEESEELAAARQAFVLGTQLAEQAQWLDALEAFRRSSGLHRHAATTYNIGFCLRALGRYTQARDAMTKALAEGREHPGELSERLRGDAEGYLRELETKLARVTVSTVGPPVRLAVDGRPLRHEGGRGFVAGVEPVGAPGPVPTGFVLQLDPGDHSFLVEQRNERTVVNLSLDPGAVESLELGAPVRPVAPPDYRPGAYTAWAIGGLGLVTGIVTGSLAIGDKGALDDVCADRVCPPEEDGRVARFQTLADISTTSFVVGGATSVLGTVLYFVSPHEGFAIEGDVGLGGVDLRLRF